MDNQANITETGLKIEGSWENARNANNAALYKQVIREVFGVQDVIIAHHLVYVTEEKHKDGFSYQIVEEVPSADTLIFDHEVAKRLFGEEEFRDILAELAMTPCEKRDGVYALFVNDPARKRYNT